MSIPVVILAGGTGTRLKEMTEFLPKPMVSIGGQPIIWHIMKHYSSYGYFRFILALGYKQEKFKEFFMNMNECVGDITVHTALKIIEYHKSKTSWSVTMCDTGVNALKSDRLRLIKQHIKSDVFMLTYGDGVSTVDLHALLAYHHSHDGIATVTGIHAPSKFGEMECDGNGRVLCFKEKPNDINSMSNGGFMVFNKEIFDYLIPGCDLEIEIFDSLVEKGQLFMYPHKGFWKNMDTLKDMGELEALWQCGNPPWKTW